MKRVRFAPSPTGSLHVGNALSAVANRELGDWMLLRIDDTDPARNVPGGEEQIIRDLRWLGLQWEAGPVRQTERADRHREAAAALGERFDGITLLRSDGGIDARALVRELKAIGGNLRALRVALTGQERGPELWTVIAALPRDETLRRIDASLTPSSRRSQGSQAGGAQDSAERHGQAPPAPDPAASGGSPSRSPAPPGGSEGRPAT